jgi:hypothetical protein
MFHKIIFVVVINIFILTNASYGESLRVPLGAWKGREKNILKETKGTAKDPYKRPEGLHELAFIDKTIATIDNYEVVTYKLPGNEKDQKRYKRFIVVYDTNTKEVAKWFDQILATYEEPTVNCYKENHLLEIHIPGDRLLVLDTQTSKKVFHGGSANVMFNNNSDYYIISHYVSGGGYVETRSHYEIKVYDINKHAMVTTVTGERCELIEGRFLSVDNKERYWNKDSRITIYDLTTTKPVLSFNGSNVLSWEPRRNNKIICTKKDFEGFLYTETYSLVTGKMLGKPIYIDKATKPVASKTTRYQL